jgi:predicted membrane channel-forming protein YqfA (hemolysin III family)
MVKLGRPPSTRARAFYIAALALFGFLIVGTLAKIWQPSSWIGETLLVAGFLLLALGGFFSMWDKER